MTIVSAVNVTRHGPLPDGSSLLRVQLHLAEQSSTYLTHRKESLQAPAVVLEAGLAHAIARVHFRQL